MAEVAVSALIGLVQAGLKGLWERIQQVKVTDAERLEVENFFDKLERCSAIFASSTHEAITDLRQTLEKCRAKLEEWSGKNSGFIARSSEQRVIELKALRQDLVESMILAGLQFHVAHHQYHVGGEKKFNSILQHVRNLDPRAPNRRPPAIGGASQSNTSKQQASRHLATPRKRPLDDIAIDGRDSRHVPALSSSSHGDQRHPTTKHPLLLNQGARPRTEPKADGSSRTKHLVANAPSGLSSKRGESSSRKVPNLTRQRSKKSTTKHPQLELWVPMDSDKQANDVKAKLGGIPGVMAVSCDQTRKKVWVQLQVHGSVETTTLLQHAKLKDKVIPTLWAERPR